MLKYALTLCPLLIFQYLLWAQKKPLDHSVYDSWQSIGERMISNDGRWIVYSINPQEGDNNLVVQSADQRYELVIPRGTGAVITEDSRFLVCRIKPFYKDTREARIKKKKPDDFPKDSLAILPLGTRDLIKWARVKSFTTPQKGYGWVAYLMEKPEPPAGKRSRDESGGKNLVDSLRHTIDSLQNLINQQEASSSKKKKRKGKDEQDDSNDITEAFYFFADEPDDRKEGTELILRNLYTGAETRFPFVNQYMFDMKGNRLLMEISANKKDSLSRPGVVWWDLAQQRADTLMRGGNDFRSFSLSEDGTQLAFLAERDSASKALRKFYKLWYYQDGLDSAIMLVDQNHTGMNLGMAVSQYGSVHFSKSGHRLFFGVAPIPPVEDTTKIEIDEVKLDVWHYNDDYLQPYQLRRLQQDLHQHFLAVYDLEAKTLQQLESKELPNVQETDEGDGQVFLGVTNFGKRVESQWKGRSLVDVYAVQVASGQAQLVKKDLDGRAYISTTGKYVTWYDNAARNYFTWDGEQIHNITAGIKTPLYDEENDIPDEPRPYGIMGWQEYDGAVYIYDRFDIWQVDPLAKATPVNITEGMGRKGKTRYRYVSLNRDERFIKPSQVILLQTFNEVTKHGGLARIKLALGEPVELVIGGAYSLGRPLKADSAEVYIYTKETFEQSPDLYTSNQFLFEKKLSAINPQQKEYNWGTAELFKWKTFDGKNSEGLLYKPEDFDPSRKYPMLVYFYETLSDRLYSYLPPAPTPSRLDIAFFVSRGYLVFTPDIHYGTGHPGKDAYNYIASGAQALAKFPWVDAKNIGIQGQSWGGYQVAYLITVTNMFKAAWAGAPVANMTSAYGGIRWGTGLNRQFQYEKTQSRIGATLWEKPDLYIENSPLFHLPKVQTPLVIMHNDADGAVPWYQGIELFTAMRRLNKKVWLLVYNGEDHNLVQRKNRKDLSIREQQYFDWMLKGEKPPKWITEGVPAVEKGKDMGLEIMY